MSNPNHVTLANFFLNETSPARVENWYLPSNSLIFNAFIPKVLEGLKGENSADLAVLCFKISLQ